MGRLECGARSEREAAAWGRAVGSFDGDARIGAQDRKADED